mgnify:FL=1
MGVTAGRILVRFLFILFLVLGWVPLRASACVARDFLNLPLPVQTSEPVWMTATLMAYPALRPGADGETLIAPDGQTVAARGMTGRSPREIILAPSFGDQFFAIYPLDRDLETRRIPYQDPGRARDQAFFTLLYGADAQTVQTDLTIVTAGPGPPAQFRVTRRHGVDCQLRAAIASLEENWDGLTPYFTTVGGSFNWRRISGTSRLSAHSYGIAIDINANLGGYWRWSGEPEGAVGDYNNQVPWRLVETMERYGFIWGGKWHHFDGMHFEYRPEIILFSRLSGGP